jgi:predicted N-acetyltransferase YhbS
MNIQIKQYNREVDFERVYDFLEDTFVADGSFHNWSPIRWEYMHFHPNLNTKELSKIGLWEDDNRIVGVANYEDELRDVYISIHPEYSFLKLPIIVYAEKNLYKMQDNGKGFIRIFVNDFDLELQEILIKRGYKKDNSYDEFRWVTEYNIPDPFPEIQLPNGFKLISLEDKNDLKKTDRGLWRGFNHPGEPPEDGIEGRKLMQSAPRFRKDLNILVEDELGNCVAYSGIWLILKYQSAYLEPVATDPDYRRMGIGKAVVMECIRRCSLIGIKKVFVESAQPFYLNIGFKKLFAIYPWVKHLDI